MSTQRIIAVLRQELYITKHSLEVIVDLWFFSFINIVIFGFVSLWLAGSQNTLGAHYLLTGMILWEIVRITQYSLSVGCLWNIWSHNLGNMFVSPLSMQEYFVAQILSGFIKACLIFVMVAFLSAVVFKFNILVIGPLNLLLYFINLTLFSWTLGIIILGFIFRFGTRIQALGWSISYLFQPLTAAFFPLSVLPESLRSIAYLLPPTYIFEAARANIMNPTTNWYLIGIAFVQNIVYLLIALWFFNTLFRKSKESGQFARNDG